MDDTYDVLIEISQGSANKYEIDEKTGKFILDFVFKDGLVFPFNYGFIPNTKAEDGDSMDVAVFSSEPIEQGAIVAVKPIAMAKMKDRGAQDDKIIAVPLGDPMAEKFNSLIDFDENRQKAFVDFYLQVAVQKNKIIKPEGFVDKEETIAEIERRKI